MTTVRAAVLRAPGTPPTVEDVELADPRDGEILVRIEAAGVCHSDYHYMTGGLTAPLPLVLGHEGAGIVEAVGPRASGRIKVGDRVALLWRPRCGVCEACVSGNPVLCELGRVQAATGGLPDGTSRLSFADGSELHHLMGVSCFAERVVVNENAAVVVPDGVPPEIAAISACAVITGVGAVWNVVEKAAGRPLLVIGAGGVGLSAIMGAALTGAHPVVAVDIDDEKLELAREFGATVTINSRQADAAAEVLAATGGRGVPWAIEAIGRPATLRQALDATAAGGTVVAVGLGAADTEFPVPLNQLVQRQKRVVGSLYGSSNPLIDLPRIFALYLAGRLPLDRLLGERMPLSEVATAYEHLVAGAVGRGILVP
ncbi:zinc-binding dehydrogenase [Gryllotalpicola protaetiae]|uniref:Zn-dependent alcohol dehydrogenase n=1 Tax=Gryllotalpicola protaetiae TaxID=2419771 RepID=A0A387BSR1_9MICO|nr:zinc-binding dehydrogenase [Gryllotalpicola protaetiae]AYG04100.1 Zn-dependent alcohol dehydrogenase [Gryllotalpicola protaetiae]